MRPAPAAQPHRCAGGVRKSASVSHRKPTQTSRATPVATPAKPLARWRTAAGVSDSAALKRGGIALLGPERKTYPDLKSPTGEDRGWPNMIGRLGLRVRGPTSRATPASGSHRPGVYLARPAGLNKGVLKQLTCCR
eukprot:1188579-Prorocentrum_minimum.AAC.3